MQTIRLLCDVANLRSFSQAAARHGITQSAASQRVGQLERRLGIMLIDRSVRPLALTAVGEEFVEGCRELMERYDILEQRIMRLRPTVSEPAGEVRIDAIYSAGIDLLNQIKDSFESKHPKVRVVVEYKRPEQVYEAVFGQRCDLGILSYPKRWRQVGVIPLRNERMVVAVAPGHPLAVRQEVDASELGEWPLLTFEPELPAGRSIRRYLRDHGVEPRITAVFDNIDTIKAAVAVTEDHYAILPKRTIAREVQAGALAAVNMEPELARPLGIIFPRHRTRNGSNHQGIFNPAVQAFVDHLLELAGPKADLAANLESSSRQPLGAQS